MFIKVNEDTIVVSPNKYAAIITLGSSNWVNIIPVTNQNQIVFFKQFRYGSNSESLEIPGGMVDDES